MEKIGIFGGTFNPVHNGHVRLAKHYMEQLGLSRMLVIPTKTPPHKAAPDLADSADRLAMCRIAFEGMEGVTVSDMEIRREGKSFTVDTVHELKKEFLDRYDPNEVVKENHLTVEQIVADIKALEA